ncbi:MAG: tRNA uridine-5-carboxymethylaminomethyl(34) synthesis GTPase MnmE [Phycisphaerae bacterium]
MRPDAMYELNDTIAAISSPASDRLVIIRISGPDTIEHLNKFFSPELSQNQHGIFNGKITIPQVPHIDAAVYLFAARRSYTAENLAEIHFYGNPALTEEIMRKFLSSGVRLARPGEFTARAYLNGRMDLSQAEAVNKIITGGNRFQLNAAQKLLAGRLTRTVSQASQQILDCLTLIEAAMDFSQEDIEFITKDQAQKTLNQIKNNLEELISTAISYENTIDLPAVGIAGSPSAGKSSLLNALLGQQRSIVSSQPKTTRDVLSGIIELEHCRCIVFDCAGLLAAPKTQIDSLAQQAALNALQNAELTIFCVDASKQDLTEDLAIRNLIIPKNFIALAAKCDLLDETRLNRRLAELKEKFGSDFLPSSSKNSLGLDTLRKTVDSVIIGEGCDEYQTACVAVNARHKHSVTQAVENLRNAVTHIKSGSDEIAAMMLRAAHQAISSIAHEHLDEKILDKIFGEFCIGK